ncbi:MAG TPA: four-helix bundle copper-binding protein [Thermoanaerobaculia bacterium]|nr:four-helix bundle copper-binding protein [Thermoanaerobaculia bacterium]
MPQQTHEMERCIALCQECHEVCLQTVPHCLEKGGQHAEAAHIQMLLDCAEICETSANFMIRGSELHMETCHACSEVCQRCASDCQRLGNDPKMQECADVCLRCAESCAQMAGAAVER